MKARLEKLASCGAVVAAAACPVCFPKLALIGALLGLGGLGAYESQLFIAAQVLIAVAVAGHLVSFRSQRNRWILGTAIIGAAAVFAGLYVFGSELAVYAGFAALVAASLPAALGADRALFSAALRGNACPLRLGAALHGINADSRPRLPPS